MRLDRGWRTPPVGWRRIVSEIEPSPVYDPDAAALFARFDVAPNEDRKQLISDMFATGKPQSWWSKLDALWVHAAHEMRAGRLNWLSSQYNCLPVNDPAFVEDRGYTGDGVSSYLDTQFNPVRAVGANYQRTCASLGIRSNTNNAEDGSLAGYWDGSKGTTINPLTAAGRSGVRINQTANSQTGVGQPKSIGMYVGNRRTGDNGAGYAKHGYHTKLAAAFAKWAARPDTPAPAGAA